MKPRLCYTIWFSQRTGSTLLCKALESTNAAGFPGEWLVHLNPEETGMQQIQQIWQSGTTSNGVFGIKHALHQKWINRFKKELQLPDSLSDPQVWESVFPGGKHIYMTRRNKVRLAVSWWRAIVSGEWHRVHGQKPDQAEISDRYSFDAINHLFLECSMREAGIEAFFAEGNITPLTIVYEDFVRNYESTVRDVLNYLEIPDADTISIDAPFFDPIADDITEEWVQRFREERQTDWPNRAW